MIDSNKRIPFEPWRDFSHNCPHFSLQISEHHSFPIATTKSDLRSNRMRLKRASGQVGEKEAGRGAMFINVKPIHHSRLPANTFYKLDKYILQFGQMHFTIWEGGMIIISKANSSVAPPAGKEEFHHFFTRVALQSLLSQHCSVLTNRNTKKSQRNINKITEKYKKFTEKYKKFTEKYKNSQIEIQKNHPILLPGCSADLFQPTLQCPRFWNLFIGHFDSILCYTHFFTIICLALWGFYWFLWFLWMK